MAVTAEAFPASKGRQSPDQRLIQSIFFLSQEISNRQPLSTLLKKPSASIIRKTGLISLLFEELVQNPVNYASASTSLCFEELYIVLQKIMKVLEDCSMFSKMWLLMQVPSISISFNRLLGELATLFEIFPFKELELYDDDVVELISLIQKCTAECVDVNDENLRSEVLKMLENIKKEMVPDQQKLYEIFTQLSLGDSISCTIEIENLEEEVRSQNDDKLKAEAVALIGLVRYGKCVLFGASSPRAAIKRQISFSEENIPADFRCPISLDLMREPVVVSTGQSYDRSSINTWIEAGHATCPKTGQKLSHRTLIPNLVLKHLIAVWCRQQHIEFESTDDIFKPNSVVLNKTALEALKMTVSFLVNELECSQTPEAVNRVVHELRVLAKMDSDSRICITEAGALPFFVKFLSSENPNLQMNTITTIFNLSILEASKKRILETDGLFKAIIEVLTVGATWEAKGNAAATVFNLTDSNSYRRRIGSKASVVNALLDLAKMGPINVKKDAMMAILNLAGDRVAVEKLIEGGVVDMVLQVINLLPEEALAVLEAVVKRGGLAAVAAAYDGCVVKKLAIVLRNGSDGAREIAAATLVNLCRRGGPEIVAEFAGITGIERVIFEVMGMGTMRARRKAATLMRVLRRLAAATLNSLLL